MHAYLLLSIPLLRMHINVSNAMIISIPRKYVQEPQKLIVVIETILAMNVNVSREDLRISILVRMGQNVVKISSWD